MFDDTAIFRARLDDYRRAGAQAILDHGVEPDPALTQELGAPGADQRHGVNLIARPPLHVVRAAQQAQARLQAQQPGQYYYPAADLHLTLLELCSNQTQAEAERLARAVATLVPALARHAPPAALERPRLGYDRWGCALNFLPADRALQDLRDQSIAQLAAHGIAIAPRYPPQSAHVTIMRYLRPVADRTAWVAALQSLPDLALDWTIDALWLTWGATWYGMHGRTRRLGPYALGLPPLSTAR